MSLTGMEVSDWIAAASNAVLAASIIIGGVVALRRWNVLFVLRLPEHPSHGESGGAGMPTIRTTSWHCTLELVDGRVAHVARVKLERRNRLGFWQQVSQATFPHEYMPGSLLPGGGLELTVSIVKGTQGPFRIRVDEYATARRSFIPFMEPERKNDFA